MRQPHCRDLERALQDFVDGTVPLGEAARLRDHVDSCSRCQARVAQRTLLRRALTPPASIELPSGFRASLLERLQQATAFPETAPASVDDAPVAESVWDRVARWWSGARVSPVFQPAAVLAGIAMAVVLASVAAQVVGTWRSPRLGSPAGSSSLAQRAPALPPASDGPRAAGESSPSRAPSVVPESPSSVPAPALMQLAAVSPEAASVVLAHGFDVVAAVDTGTIDPERAAVHLRLDGRTVNAQGVRVTRDFVSYTPEEALSEGSHRVQVEVRDAEGHSTSVEWDFYVVGS